MLDDLRDATDHRRRRVPVRGRRVRTQLPVRRPPAPGTVCPWGQIAGSPSADGRSRARTVSESEAEMWFASR